jgi:hypothetical protein
VTLRARWVTLRARWVTLRARWVTLRARWVVLLQEQRAWPAALRVALAGNPSRPHGPHTNVAASSSSSAGLLRPLLTAYTSDALGPHATPASTRLAVAVALESCLHVADTPLLFNHLAPLFAATPAGVCDASERDTVRVTQ